MRWPETKKVCVSITLTAAPLHYIVERLRESLGREAAEMPLPTGLVDRCELMMCLLQYRAPIDYLQSSSVLRALEPFKTGEDVLAARTLL